MTVINALPQKIASASNDEGHIVNAFLPQLAVDLVDDITEQGSAAFDMLGVLVFATCVELYPFPLKVLSGLIRPHNAGLAIDNQFFHRSEDSDPQSVNRSQT